MSCKVSKFSKGLMIGTVIHVTLQLVCMCVCVGECLHVCTHHLVQEFDMANIQHIPVWHANLGFVHSYPKQPPFPTVWNQTHSELHIKTVMSIISMDDSISHEPTWTAVLL